MYSTAYLVSGSRQSGYLGGTSSLAIISPSWPGLGPATVLSATVSKRGQNDDFALTRGRAAPAAAAAHADLLTLIVFSAHVAARARSLLVVNPPSWASKGQRRLRSRTRLPSLSQIPRRLRIRAIVLHSFACNTLFGIPPATRKWKKKRTLITPRVPIEYEICKQHTRRHGYKDKSRTRSTVEVPLALLLFRKFRTTTIQHTVSK